SRMTPVFHKVLPSPTTLNETAAFELPAVSSTPTKAENRSPPRARLILGTLVACVPRPCSKFFPAIESVLPVTDLSPWAWPQPEVQLEISSEEIQTLSEPHATAGARSLMTSRQRATEGIRFTRISCS